MTTREKRIAELDEQRRCLEQLTEDDIGCEVWVRDYMDFPWSGPYSFRGFGTGRLMFGANDACWVFATKTPPIEPQKITLRRLEGIKFSESGETVLLIRYRDGKIDATKVEDVPSYCWRWNNNNNEHDITHFAPIEIEVEE